jgi:hypothetical protein
MESEPLPEPADPQRSNLLSIAGLLEPYNTGTVGPEECK